MDDLRDLRDLGDEEADLGFGEEEFALDDVGEGKGFLGMTPVERMFISIFLFMNVLVIGLALLLATSRIQF